LSVKYCSSNPFPIGFINDHCKFVTVAV